jgi:hypothetical protein
MLSVVIDRSECSTSILGHFNTGKIPVSIEWVAGFSPTTFPDLMELPGFDSQIVQPTAQLL